MTVGLWIIGAILYSALGMTALAAFQRYAKPGFAFTEDEAGTALMATLLWPLCFVMFLCIKVLDFLGRHAFKGLLK